MAVKYYNDPFNSPYASSYRGFQSGPGMGFQSSPDYSKYPGQGNQGGGFGQWLQQNQGLIGTIGGILGGLSNMFEGRAQRKLTEKEIEERRRQFDELMRQRRSEYMDEQRRQRGVAMIAQPLFQALAGSNIGKGPVSGLQNLFSGQ